MNFVVIVSAIPEKSYSALKFVQTALSMQHTIQVVFFYQDGVVLANKFINLPKDEINIQHNWQDIQDTRLLICSSSALRRGISEEHLASGFTFSSLGKLIEECSVADRVITFK